MSGGFAGGLAHGFQSGLQLGASFDEAKKRKEDAELRQQARRMSDGIVNEVLDRTQAAAPGATAPAGNPVAGGVQAPAQAPRPRDLSVDEYANIYRTYMLQSAGNPYAQKALAPALEYVRNAGIAKAMSGVQGDPSTLAGAMDMYHGYGRALAMFGEVQDPAAMIDVASKAENATRARELHGLDMRAGALTLRDAERTDREGAYQEQALGDLRSRLDASAPGRAFGPFANEIEAAAAQAGVRADLLSALIKQESDFNPQAVGDGGNSVGLGQFNVKGALADMGLTKEQVLSMSPQEQIMRVAKFYSQKVQEAGGDPIKGLRYYNGRGKGGDPNYVGNVLQHLPRQNREGRRQAIADYKARTAPDKFQEEEEDAATYAENRLKLFKGAYQLARAGDIDGAVEAINRGDTGFSITGYQEAMKELPDGRKTPDIQLQVRDDDDGEVRQMQLSDMLVGLGGEDYKWEMRNVKSGDFGQEQLVAVKVPKDGGGQIPEVVPLQVPSSEPEPVKKPSGPSWIQQLLGTAKAEQPAEAAPAPKTEAQAPAAAKSGPDGFVQLSKKDGQLVAVEGKGTRPLRDGDKFRYQGRPVIVKGGEIYPLDE